MAAGSIIIDLLMKTGSFETDTKRAEKRLREFKKEAMSLATSVGVGVAGAVTGLAMLTKRAIDFADEIGDLSQVVGVSTETLSGWGYAAKMSGTELQSLTSALPRLAKNLAAAADESSTSGKLFKSLGVEVKDAEGNLRSVEDVLPELADRFQTLDNETQEAALAQALFGKSGAVLLQFLNRGSTGIAALTDEARSLGAVIGQDTADAAGSFNDQLDKLVALSQSLGLQIAERLLPQLENLGNSLMDFIKDGDKVTDLAESISATFTVLTTAAGYVATAFKLVGAGIATVIGQAVALGKMATGDREGGKALYMTASEGLGEEWDKAFGDKPEATNKKESTKVLASWEQDIPNSMLRYPSPKKTPQIDGKGNAQKSEADKLNDSYDRLIAQQEEVIALFGQQSEAASMAYQLQNGELKGLGDEQKEQLQANAEWLDWQQEMADIESAWADSANEYADAQERLQHQFEDTLAYLEDEMKMLTMTADEWEIYNAKRAAGALDDSDKAAEIERQVKANQALRDATMDQVDALDSVRDAGVNVLVDIGDGESALDALQDGLDGIRDRIIEIAAENMMDALFGKQGDVSGGLFDSLFGGGHSGSAGGSDGGWWSSLLSWGGSLFGGGKAGGGDVLDSRSYLVGEQGPEMFVPRTAGTILTADQTASVRGRNKARPFQQTNNFVLQGKADRRSMSQIEAATARAGRRAEARA